MPTGTTGQTGSAQNYDTPVGVGGQINTNTGQITSGTLAGQQAGTATNNYAPTPPVSQTQNASAIQQHLSGSTTGTVFPPAPTAPTGGTSANTSIPAPIPSAQDIINQGNQQTPGEATNQTLLQKVAALIGSNKTQTTLTNESEAAAGVPGLNKTLNDLNTQLEGLTNQAADLANQAQPGGAIQNQEQQNAQGRGITAAGLAPLTAGDLRENQIKQSAIASQSLTLKSAIYGVNGQITLARDAADKAATAQYEVEQQQIDYMNALIKANEPQMTKEEKNQALLVQSNLQDRQNKIQQAQDDKKTIVGLAVAAMTNNPNNPQAQYAAQQALAESNKTQPDLQAALGLVGAYQRDPNAVALQVAQLQHERASTQQINKAMQDTNPVDIKPGDKNYKIAQDLAYGNLSFANFKSLYGRAASTAGLKTSIYDLASQLNPNFNPSAFELGYSFAANPKIRQQVASLDNVQNVTPEILKASQDAARTGTGLNNLVIKGGIAIGNSNYSNFQTARIAYADELSGALGYGSATDMGRAMGFDMTNSSLSAQQFADGINKYVVPFVASKRGTLVNQMGVYGSDINQFSAGGSNSGASGGDFASSAPNYSADLANAKAAIAAGADAAQVKARMLTKYKQVDL